MVPSSPGKKCATEESDILIFSTTAFTGEYAAISHVVFLTKRCDSCLNSGTFIPDDKKKKKKKERRKKRWTSEVDDTQQQNPPFSNSPSPPGLNATGSDKNKIKNSNYQVWRKRKKKELFWSDDASHRSRYLQAAADWHIKSEKEPHTNIDGCIKVG